MYLNLRIARQNWIQCHSTRHIKSASSYIYESDIYHLQCSVIVIHVCMPGNEWLRMWHVCMHNVCMIIHVWLWRNFAMAYEIAICIIECIAKHKAWLRYLHFVILPLCGKKKCYCYLSFATFRYLCMNAW